MRMIQFGPRDRGEAHRAATPLELMFDLATVVAVAAASAGLHHGVADGHALETLPGFFSAFFMIWWSWMNYTWFASAYDDGSVEFRVLSMTAMFGALTIAAGVPAIFDGKPIYLCLLGFVIMRAAMAALWFGAAAGDPGHRKTARAYGVGIFMMQAYWIVMILSVPPLSPLYMPLFLLGVIGELGVPAFAEFRHGATSWHRPHIMERYGLFNIIVLGECFLSIVAMLTDDGSGGLPAGHVLASAAAAAVVTFSMWAIYFTSGDHLETDEIKRALLWGYGHFAIFAAGAATGAGFAIYHDAAVDHAEIELKSAGLAIAIPVAIYLLILWIVRDRFHLKGAPLLILPAGAAALAVAPVVLSDPLIAMAAIMAAVAILRAAPERARRGGAPSPEF